MGWIRTSAAMVRRLAALRASMDLGSPVLEQLVVTRLQADVETWHRPVAPSWPRPATICSAGSAKPSRSGARRTSAACVCGWTSEHRCSAGSSARPGATPSSPNRGSTARAGRRARTLPAAVPCTLRRDRVEPALERLGEARQAPDQGMPGDDPEPVAVA
ncbi:MAG: hypothetical protein ACRDRH_11275 [Pseudonocardia sp.]